MKKTTSSLVAFFVATLAFGAGGPVFSQEPKSECSDLEIQVVGPSTANRPELKLGGDLVVQFSGGLKSFLACAFKAGQEVHLFLNGNDSGLQPIDREIESNTLIFHLSRDADHRQIWAPLLSSPFEHPIRDVAVSVGLKGETPLPAKNVGFKLKVVNWGPWAYFWVAMLVLVLWGFSHLVRRRGILRDSNPPFYYSLARCQMAWWFFLLITSYVLIWLITGDKDTIDKSLVVLVGISSGTAFGAALIDSSSDAGARAPTPGELNARTPFMTILAQILTDSSDPANQKLGLHRFQILVWTLVLGIMFVTSVLKDLSMPIFSDTLLALMGISSGTYLGFKIPER